MLALAAQERADRLRRSDRGATATARSASSPEPRGSRLLRPSAVPPGLVHRCACGGIVGPTRECAACKARREAAEQRRATPSTAPPIVHAALGSPGSPLPPSARAPFEAHFGRDFSAVRIHTGPVAAASARAIDAAAYTVGNQIVFGEGQFAPNAAAGQRLLGHELAHVLQQGGRQARSGSALQVAPQDDSFERAARNAVAPQGDARGPIVQRQPQPLLPPGDCTPGEHRRLQNEVDRACDRERRCTQNDTCATIWERIGHNAECIRARTIINMRCFRGGDPGHVIALAAAVAALMNCWAVWNRRCQGEPVPVPVPVPEPEPAPAPAPAQRPAPAPQPQPAPVPTPPMPAPQPAPQPAPRPDPDFMDRMAKITGLTGTALIIYLIISEGSRLFPPRNLVPVP